MVGATHGACFTVPKSIYIVATHRVLHEWHAVLSNCRDTRTEAEVHAYASRDGQYRGIAGSLIKNVVA